MAETKLDQIVKGVPPPNVSTSAIASSVISNPPSASLAVASHQPLAPYQASDPLSSLPQASNQVYLNLLILEASLRSQYVALRARRRQHTFFLLLLTFWTAYFGWALFLRPREDGGFGGSVYWVLDMYEKVSFLGGVITAILVWATGQWERGVRWPRRWVGVTNRGLRTVNLKVVILKGPWWKQLLSTLTILLPRKTLFVSTSSSYRYIPVDLEKSIDQAATSGQHRHPSIVSRGNELPGMKEEDLASGGDYVKLLLLPKHFSADFRQNWETFRAEYWDAENNRRGNLRRALRKQQLARAKSEGGWLWWVRYKGLRIALSQGGIATTGPDAEKLLAHSRHNSKSGASTVRKSRTKDGVESNSRSSSISSNATSGNSEYTDERVLRSSRRSSLRSSTSSSTTARKPRKSASERDEPTPPLTRLRDRSKELSYESDAITIGGDESGVELSERKSRVTRAGAQEAQKSSIEKVINASNGEEPDTTLLRHVKKEEEDG